MVTVFANGQRPQLKAIPALHQIFIAVSNTSHILAFQISFYEIPVSFCFSPDFLDLVFARAYSGKDHA
jgi:hypothetical protein